MEKVLRTSDAKETEREKFESPLDSLRLEL